MVSRTKCLGKFSRVGLLSLAVVTASAPVRAAEQDFVSYALTAAQNNPGTTVAAVAVGGLAVGGVCALWKQHQAIKGLTARIEALQACPVDAVVVGGAVDEEEVASSTGHVDLAGQLDQLGNEVNALRAILQDGYTVKSEGHEVLLRPLMEQVTDAWRAYDQLFHRIQQGEASRQETAEALQADIKRLGVYAEGVAKHVQTSGTAVEAQLSENAKKIQELTDLLAKTSALLTQFDTRFQQLERATPPQRQTRRAVISGGNSPRGASLAGMPSSMFVSRRGGGAGQEDSGMSFLSQSWAGSTASSSERGLSPLKLSQSESSVPRSRSHKSGKPKAPKSAPALAFASSEGEGAQGAMVNASDRGAFLALVQASAPVVSQHQVVSTALLASPRTSPSRRSSLGKTEEGAVTGALLLQRQEAEEDVIEVANAGGGEVSDPSLRSRRNSGELGGGENVSSRGKVVPVSSSSSPSGEEKGDDDEITGETV